MTTHSKTPAPGTVLGTIAIVLALAGSAIALPGKGKVDANDLRKNAVKSKAIKDGAVKGRKIAPGAVGAQQLADGAVGAQQLADVGVQPLALINGWESYSVPETGTPAAVRDGFGFVHLESAIYQASGTSAVPFTVPAGYRPAHQVFSPVATGPGSPTAELLIKPDGTTELGGYDGALVSLEGVVYRAGD